MEIQMKKIKELFSKGVALTEKAVDHATDASKSAKEHWEENKDSYHAQGKDIPTQRVKTTI